MPVQPDPGDDDLTRITGIECEAAARLRDAGIRTVDDLARATVEQVVAVCGNGVAANARAQGWIEQAAELADRVPSAARSGDTGQARLLPRRTFTLEVWVDCDAAQVVATRVVHLETQDADAWSGWSPSRLLDFVETRTGVTDPEHSRTDSGVNASEHGPAVAETAVPARDVALAVTDGANSTPQPPPLVIHRFGLLKAAAQVTQRGEMAARLRLDPTDLDLPANLPAVAHVELLARPLGAGRAEVLDARVIDLAAGRVLHAVLRGRLPGQDPPFAIMAIVRVLVGQPSGPPKQDLGGATLELVRSDDPAA